MHAHTQAHVYTFFLLRLSSHVYATTSGIDTGRNASGEFPLCRPMPINRCALQMPDCLSLCRVPNNI